MNVTHDPMLPTNSSTYATPGRPSSPCTLGAERARDRSLPAALPRPLRQRRYARREGVVKLPPVAERRRPRDPALDHPGAH